jgi:hypothetical protein
MAYVLKGFVSIKHLINNNKESVARIGEISTEGLTYSRDRTEYEHSTSPGYRLVGMQTKDTTAGQLPVPESIVQEVLAISKWSLEFLKFKTMPVSKTTYSDALVVEFYQKIANLNFGKIVDMGDDRMPEWISYNSVDNTNASITVWFCDDAFKLQYPEYSITVVPPIDNLDDFFLSPNAVKTRLEARKPTDVTNLVQIKKEGDPESFIRTETFDYVSPADANYKLPTNWTVLIYGYAGDNLDAIKAAIIEYIMANTTHTTAQWTAILPDLFKRTEFTLFPRWDKIAIPDLSVERGMYSPILNHKETISFLKIKQQEVPATYIDDHAESFEHRYRSVTIACVGNPENRLGSVNLRDVFRDYINVGTSTIDFNRMSLKTQKFSLLLERMLIVAESMEEYSNIPLDMRKVKRGNILYVSARYENVQYLVAAKINYGLVI